MMKVWLLVCACLLLVQLCNSQCTDFTAPSGKKYPLSSLTKTNGDYNGKEAGADYTYVYNFCKNTASTCASPTPAAQTSGTQCTSIGYLPGTVVELANGNGVNITYTNTLDSKCGPTKSTNRISIFSITCDSSLPASPAFVLSGITEPGQCQYLFTGKSKFACAGGKSSSTTGGNNHGGKSEGLSPGSIFLIIFFCSAFVYFAAGAAFKFKKYDARGVDMVPNVEFWAELPGLIRDGFLFVKNKITGKLGYSSL